MALEPWCFHPDQIATLTDWQIENLYRRPQLARLEEIQRDYGSAAGDGGAGGGWGAGESAPRNRDGTGGPLAHIGGTEGDAAAGLKAKIAAGEAPTKGELVTLMCAFGYKPEVAAAEADRQLAEFAQARAKNRTGGAPT
jgi:hypothetical protein